MQSNNPANPWQEDPIFPMDEWQEAVEHKKTLLGYWDWVGHQREMRADEPELKL